MATDYYSILELKNHTATPDEIREAYRKLARIYHPDLPENKLDPNTATKFIQIQEAYETLIDPDKRRAYDKKFSPSGALLKVGGKALSTMNRILDNPDLAHHMDKVTNNLGWNYNRMIDDLKPMFGNKNSSQQSQQTNSDTGEHIHKLFQTKTGNLVCTLCGEEFNKEEKKKSNSTKR